MSSSIDDREEIIDTKNGNPTDMVSFASKEREAFLGTLLTIVRSEKGKSGIIKVAASSQGLKQATIEIKSK